VVAVSAIWGFFHLRVTELKNEQITTLQQENERLQRQAATPEVLSAISSNIHALDQRISPIVLAFDIDRFDGHFSMMDGKIRGPNRATKLLADADNLREERKFDLAAKKLDEIGLLAPNLPAIAYERFLIEKDKGNDATALAGAEEFVRQLPDDARTLSAVDFASTQYLKQNNRKRAEEYALYAIRLDTTNTQRRQHFTEVFGYKPSVSDNK